MVKQRRLPTLVNILVDIKSLLQSWVYTSEVVDDLPFSLLYDP